MRNMLMSDPVKFEMIKQRFPELADAIQKNDTPKMLQLLSQVSSGLGGENFLQTPVIANDFDMEAQKRIAENIRLQNVQQNMESALEYMPEGKLKKKTVKIYLKYKING